MDTANEAAEMLQDLDENARTRDVEKGEHVVNTPEELAEYNFSTEETNE
jgi:hypothetical protein